MQPIYLEFSTLRGRAGWRFNSMFFGTKNAPKIEMKIGTRYHFGKDISMNRQFIPISGYFVPFEFGLTGQYQVEPF